MEERYDYIICGAGCAGLSLAYYLSQHDLGDRKILLLDKDPKTANDHTWCFWQKGNSPFDEIVEMQYDTLKFMNKDLSKSLNIAPYKYKKINGVDFYQFVRKQLRNNPSISWRQEEVTSFEETENSIIVKCGSKIYEGGIAFKSYIDSDFNYENHHHVLQHFQGWEIESAQNEFEVNTATFMDFRIDQKGEIRFLYVLPTSTKSALVEVAIFSNSILTTTAYDAILSDYITNTLKVDEYKIRQSEFGVIPMTTYPFERLNTTRLKRIGSAGGWVKASSGFAFDRIQRKAKKLATAIVEGSKIGEVISSKNRFRLYDQIFLNALLTNKTRGDEVFGRLFDRLDSSLVFEFLDEETSFIKDLKLFTGPPTIPFLKAFLEEI